MVCVLHVISHLREFCQVWTCAGRLTPWQTLISLLSTVLIPYARSALVEYESTVETEEHTQSPPESSDDEAQAEGALATERQAQLWNTLKYAAKLVKRRPHTVAFMLYELAELYQFTLFASKASPYASLALRWLGLRLQRKTTQNTPEPASSSRFWTFLK